MDSRSGRDSHGESSDSSFESAGLFDINITPFVDVVLVLLVIFMVTAPMMMKDIIGLKLPEVVSAESQDLSTLAVAVTESGQFLLNGQLVPDTDLMSAAREAVLKKKETQVVITADRDARHGDVVRAIDLVKTAGVINFAIQVERSRREQP